jgi:prepilin-type N-terminal cleavage/methylation domain-containing protein
MRHIRADSASGGPDQSGFTLIEVVVAMSIFTIMAGTVLGLLVQTARATGDNLRRTTASNLATRQIESVRNLDLINDLGALPIGQTTLSPSPVVGGITYTLTQNITLADKSSSTSKCDANSGSTLAYKLVTVSVTWPNMGSIPPVRADTLKAVGIGTDMAAALPDGYAAISANGADGDLGGIPITLTPAASQTLTQTTSTDGTGCTIFTRTPGSYTASANTPGYVGTLNTQAVSKVVTPNLTAGTLVQNDVTYAQARSVDVALDIPAGATVATGIPLRVGGSFVSEATVPTCVSTPTSACTTGLPGTISNLYPDTYVVKAGACTDAFSQSMALTGAASAARQTATLQLGAITVSVKTLVGSTAVVGRTVTFAHAAGCTESYTATTNSAGAIVLALPYGTWNVTTTTLTATPGIPVLTQSVAVSTATRTGTAALKVIS